MKKQEGFVSSLLKFFSVQIWDMLKDFVSLLLYRQRGLSGKSSVVDGNRRIRPRDRGSRAIPAPEANAELPANLDVSYTSSFFLFVLCKFSSFVYQIPNSMVMPYK